MGLDIAPTFKIHIEKGKSRMFVRDKERYQRYIETLKDGIYLVSLKRFFRNRTNSQNAYLWGVIYAILSDYTGYEPEEMHEICLANFSNQIVEIQTPEGIMEMNQVKRSSRMTTMEFNDFIERIKRWASQDLALYIPNPNEVGIF